MRMNLRQMKGRGSFAPAFVALDDYSIAALIR
jgi:hypothetical protein